MGKRVIRARRIMGGLAFGRWDQGGEGPCEVEGVIEFVLAVEEQAEEAVALGALAGSAARSRVSSGSAARL